MEQVELPQWETALIDEAIRNAEERLADEAERAQRRAVQLAREQAYHRLALAIDRPSRDRAGRGDVSPSQLSFFPEPTLFDTEDE